MKMKLTLLIAAAAVVMGMSAFAADIEYSVNDGKIVFESTEQSVISCYENGILVYSDMFSPENGKISAQLPEKYAAAEKRVYIKGGEVSALKEKAEVTPTPTPSGTGMLPIFPKDTPAAYPDRTDAVNTFMVFEKLSSVQNNDGENAYEVQAYYQGRNVSVPINSDVLINTAPEKDSAIAGNDASALKKGDIFKLGFNLSKTKVVRIDLIYRPDINDIASNDEDYGDNFEKLFTYNGMVGGMKNCIAAQYGKKNSAKCEYAFGIITDKSNGTISLMNKSGKVKDTMEIDISPDTVVYVCKYGRGYEISARGISGITKTHIQSAVLNDDDSVIKWDSSYKYSYALVRITDGTATDIAVFNNYS